MSEISKRTNWALIAVAYFALLALGLLDNARGPFFPDITRDLALSDTSASFLFVVVSGMAFFSGRAVPGLAQKIGLMNLLRLGTFLMGMGFCSLSFATGLWSLIATCTIFGFGFGLINVVQNLLIIDGSYGQLRRRLFSGLHAMYALAAFISPIIAMQMFRWGISWRHVFLGLSSIAFLSFFSTFFAKTDERRPSAKNSVRHPNRKSYFVIGTMLSFYIMAELLISTRLSLYLRREYNFSADQAALYLSYFFALLMIGRGFFLLKHFRTGNLRIIELGLILTFISYALGYWVHPIFLAVCGLTMAPIFALSLDFISEKFPNYSTDAVSSSLALSCIYIVCMHYSVGFITDYFGIRIAISLGLLFLTISFGFLKLFAWQQGK